MMEDSAFVTDQAEEVIDLVDIVTALPCTENGTVQVDPCADAVFSDVPCSDAHEGQGAEAEAVPSDADCACPEIASSEVGEPEAEPDVSEEVRPACAGAPVDSVETQAVLECPMSGTEESFGAASPIQEAALSQEPASADEGQSSAIRRLEEKLAASEEARHALEEKVEGLQQQLAECSSMFLNDASVRLAVEEMVSRMVDARFSAEPEERGASEVAGPVPLDERIDALEARMREWEARSSQMAAASAARVIREEIAAMRAEASRSLR